MDYLKCVLVVSVLFLLLVGGASAVTFVIDSEDAALSLAATPDQEVVFSFIAAKDPASYSATMTADDSSGATVTQESSVKDADFVFSASAGISPDGDSAYTFSELWNGSINATLEASASQGNSASVGQQTTGSGKAGDSVCAATGPGGDTASESVMFILGALTANLIADTKNNVSATLSGTAAGASANTLGIARSADGDSSYTNAILHTGQLTFDDAATATGTITTASQDVMVAGLIGSADAGSIDQDGNAASQTAGFFDGVLATDQTADTRTSANAVQEGDFAGAGAMTGGFALAANGAVSYSNARMLVGAMSFDDTVTAQDTYTSTGQIVSIGALAGEASAESRDGTNWTGEGSGIIAGTLEANQSTAAGGSSHSVQSGMLIGDLGTTWGEATSGGERSFTSSNVTTGILTVSSNEVYAGSITNASQNLTIAGYKGDAWVGSTHGTNYARVGAGFNGLSLLTSGVLTMDQITNDLQYTNILNDANAQQIGTVRTLNTTPGGAWTQAAGGNSSGRFVEVGTQGRFTTITVYSSVLCDDALSLAYEDKTRSAVFPTSTTTAYATNGISTSVHSYSGIDMRTRGSAMVIANTPITSLY